MLKFEYLKNNKIFFYSIIIYVSILFNFFVIQIGQYFLINNGSLLFDIIFLFIIFILLLYSCYLLFFSNYTKNEIAINLNFWICVIFMFLFINLFLFGFNYDFFFGSKFLYFNNYLCIDSSVFFIRLWIIFFSFITTILLEFFLINNKYSVIEFPLLILICSYILVLSVSVIDIFSMLIILESISFLIIGLSIMTFSRISIEGTLKYFIQNTLITGLSVFGIFGIYFSIKYTNFFILKIAINLIFYNTINYNVLFIFCIFNLWLLSILFKLGVFPVHFYVADIYEISPFTSIFFLSSVIKPSIFYIFCKIYFIVIDNFSFFFSYFFIFIGFISVFIGNILAFGETKIKRFLGYTSISQFGFLIICLSVKSVELICFSFIYMFLYNMFFLLLVFIFIGFSSFLHISTITNFSDIGYILQNETLLKILVTIALFSISGLPPLVLFLFKYLMLYSLFLNIYYIIILFLILLNVISAIYYFKVISNIWIFEINNEELEYNNSSHNFFIFEYNKNLLNYLVKYIFIFINLLIFFLFKYFDFIFINLMISFIDSFTF